MRHHRYSRCLMSTRILGCALSVFVAGCFPQTNNKQDANTSAPVNKNITLSTGYANGVVYALNVGGDEYTALNGIVYQADKLDITTAKGTSTEIRGSQTPELFETFRQGELRITVPLENGEYAIQFHFAEPDIDMKVGQRVFDVVAENHTVIPALDVRLARDNQPVSSLSRTVTGVTVADGDLDIALVSIAGEPVLHAFEVREVRKDERPWQLIFADEFDVPGPPDTTKWTHDIWPARKVNNEDQAYTDSPKNARVEEGHLIIEAHLEQVAEAKYSSARLHTLGKLDFQYGKVEASIRVPAGQGTWAAFWMLPSDPFRYATTCQQGEDWQGSETCNAWPNSGEIDILEHVGYDMQRIHGTVHTNAYYWVNWQQRKASVEGDHIDQQFRRYGLEWSPEAIIISYEGVPYFYYHNEGDGWQSWPFDHPYHLILNLAIGGDWGRAGGPIDDSLFPVRMEVDYVRVYQLAQ